ncbi:MAG: response regulator transcription factor, partial [Chloroflexota bacterium]|nr:response regulator transcription factor [Chloroflexota bacterium]
VLTVAFQVYRPGYILAAAHTGAEALAMLEDNGPDLVLLDVMLPDLDGFEICRRIRAKSDVPIILLTARGQKEDVIKGLELGADDYITKPFSHQELMARIDALFRRARASLPNGQAGIFRSGELVVDFAQRRATVRGRPVELTPKEYELLELLARNAGQVLNHETLLARIWGAHYRDEPQYLKTYIYRLRRKIEESPHRPRYIVSHYGTGYRLEQHGPAEEAAAVGPRGHLGILPNSSCV